jgi:type IV pilus assembly protein PilA
MTAIKRLTKRGFTLIELMIVVVIIGILAALAIYGVQKYVANSKSAEARMMLGRMSKDMLTFYEGENQNYAVLALGKSADISRSLCPPAAGVPATVPASAKIQPDPDNFRDGEGWSCMRTVMTTPVYFRYNVLSSQTGSFTKKTLIKAAAAQTFTAQATGDLDGDAVTSLFQLGGEVKATTSKDLMLVLATTVNELAAEE